MWEMPSGPHADYRMTAIGPAVADGQRYAMLPMGDGHSVFAQAMQGIDNAAVHASKRLKNKELYMGLLALIMLITGALTFTFWRHLSEAYAPRRGSSRPD